METFLTVLAIVFVPLAIPLLLWHRFHRTVTPLELILNICAVFVVGGITIGVASFAAVTDYAIINGKVTGKKSERVSCSHSYSCRCRSVRTGKTTTTHCDTCYDHFYDMSWHVYSTVGQFTIDRVDRQGLQTPPRWDAVLIGEPAATTERYDNYIMAAPESLFNNDKEFLKKYPIVKYPAPHDYYRINRVVNVDSKVPTATMKAISDGLNLRLEKLGASRQVNFIVVMTKTQDTQFAEALKARWLGGKKNDVVVVISTADGQNVSWVRVFSWSRNTRVNYAIQDDITSLDPQVVVDAIAGDAEKFFVRRPMEEFKYLADEYTPPAWVLALAFVLCLLTSAGLFTFFHHNEVV